MMKLSKHTFLRILLMVGVIAFVVGSGQSVSTAGRQASTTPTPPVLSDRLSGDDWDGTAPRGPVIAAGESPEAMATFPSEVPLALSGGAIQSLAIGLSFSCALTDGGTVSCWGDNAWGQLGNGTNLLSPAPVSVLGLNNVRDISASFKHICAVTLTGGVKCWGRNYHGELGDGTTVDHAYPVDVSGLTSGVQQIAAGGYHTCALTDAGGVKCWGVNWHGQLGDGLTLNTRLVPVDVIGLSDMRSVSVGRWHTCAITASKGVKCWGYNMFGQLGNGTANMDNPLPLDVTGLSSGVASLALGAKHTCALMENGTVKCWGDNTYGQVGDGTDTWRWTPVDVPALVNVQALWAGSYHNCALLAGGQVRCWGDNWAGQIGDATNIVRRSPISPIGLPGQVIGLDAGDAHSCAILSSGRVMCWGSNSFGQIGTGEAALRLQAVMPLNVNDVIQVGTGLRHTCALTASGAVKCWGGNEYGQLGDGTNIDRLAPIDVLGLQSGVTAIAAGENHTCAVAYGRVKCWGYNALGQLGNQSNITSYIPVDVAVIGGAVTTVTAGGNHSCAVETGHIYCWGRNDLGQLGDVTYTDRNFPGIVINLAELSMVSVAAGENHTCGLANNGKIKCWGYNFYGQLGTGDNFDMNYALDVKYQNFVGTSIVTGRSHTCALSEAGQMWCWGANASGQLGTTSLINANYPVAVSYMGSGIAAISAGQLSTCGVLANRHAKCWGDNWAGQLGDGTTYSRYEAVDALAGGANIVGMSVGDIHTCAWDMSGGLRCWGSNSNGQLGSGAAPWQTSPALVAGLWDALFTIDYPNGQPGSYFTLTGSQFWPEQSLNIIVNGHTLTQTLTTDGDGNLNFILSSSQAQAGYYIIAVQGEYDQAGLAFTLSDDAPLRPQSGSGLVIDLPPGIAYTNLVYLPVAIK